MPKIQHMGAFTFQQLEREAQLWNGGFVVVTPDSLTPLDDCTQLMDRGWAEFRAELGDDPWRLDGYDCNVCNSHGCPDCDTATQTQGEEQLTKFEPISGDVSG